MLRLIKFVVLVQIIIGLALLSVTAADARAKGKPKGKPKPEEAPAVTAPADAAAAGQAAPDKGGKAGKDAKATPAGNLEGQGDTEGDDGLGEKFLNCPDAATAAAASRAAARENIPELTRDEVDKVVDRFFQRAQQFQDDMDKEIKAEAVKKSGDLRNRFDDEINLLEAKEVDSILSGIEKFKKFLVKYPNNGTFTPDVMFRLAELEFLKSDSEYKIDKAAAIARYEKALNDFDKGMDDYSKNLEAWWDGGKKGAEPKPPEEPPPPGPDFTASIYYYDMIIAKFPTYRYIDAVYYLKAHAHQERQELEKVRIAMAAMITVRPDSPYIADAYLRMGDAYYQEYKYDKALEALEKADKVQEGPLKDRIIYTLASTYFIADRFQDGIDGFVRLIDYSEKMKNDPKIGQASYFRDESIKFIAITYAQGTEFWKNSGVDNMRKYFDKIGHRSWDWEVFNELGNYYKSLTKWDEAVASYRLAIDVNPLNSAAPQIQSAIIQMYFNKDDEAGQARERKRLAEDFAQGSNWAKQNGNNPEALRRARILAQDSLKFYASYQHRLAQQQKKIAEELKAGGDDRGWRDAMKKSKEYYEGAAKFYREFLTSFPNDLESYNLRYMLAEALYFSGEFRDAIKEYRAVLASRLSDKYREPSAYNIVLSYAEILAQKFPQAEEAAVDEKDKAKPKVEEQKIEEIVETDFDPDEACYVTAGDYYINSTKMTDDKDTVAYNSAFYFFKHMKLKPARKRFIAFVNSYPKAAKAPEAAKKIIETYVLEKDWVQVQEWSQKLADLSLGEGGGRRGLNPYLAKTLKVAIAEHAEVLRQRGEFEKAADEFMRVVEAQADDPQTASAALFNAALMYQQANRPARAMELYGRMVSDFPDAPFAATAQGRLAEAAYASYNLDEAAAAYQRLYTRYKIEAGQDDPGNTRQKENCDARYLHAELLEFDHRYLQAAKLYEEYANKCGDLVGDGADKLLKAAKIYSSMDDYANMDRIYNSFITKYGKDAKNYRWVIKAYREMGDLFLARKQEAKAKDYFAKAVDFFDKHPELVGDKTANESAAAAKWVLLEDSLKEFMAVRMTAKNQEELAARFKEKSAKVAETIRKYDELAKYKAPEQLLGRSYMRGYLTEMYADAMFDAPMPQDLLRKFGRDFEDVYKDQTNEATRPIYKEASKLYMAALEEARNNKMFGSPWMKKIIDALNRDKLKEFAVGEFSARKRELSSIRETVLLPTMLETGKPHVAVAKPKETEQPAAGENGQAAPGDDRRGAPQENQNQGDAVPPPP